MKINLDQVWPSYLLRSVRLMLAWLSLTSLSGSTERKDKSTKVSMNVHTSFQGSDHGRCEKVGSVQVDPHQVGGVEENGGKALRDNL